MLKKDPCKGFHQHCVLMGLILAVPLDRDRAVVVEGNDNHTEVGASVDDYKEGGI